MRMSDIKREQRSFQAEGTEKSSPGDGEPLGKF